jgi:carboxyl-terminal processing protease
MTRRFLSVVTAAFALVAPAAAQLTSEAKEEVLEEIDRVLIEDAFVPGIELGGWRTFIGSQQSRLDDAETPYEFTRVVNQALGKFGISHIQISPPRMRRRSSWRQEFSLQGSSYRSGAQLRWAKSDTAVLRLGSFNYGYNRDQIDEIFAQAKDARKLVIDFRGNPGGEVQNMRHFLGLVMPPRAAVGTFVTKRMAREFVRSGRGEGKDPVAVAAWANRRFGGIQPNLEPFRGKIAVLIDGKSASAAEIVANALRENRQSPLIGAPTAGAVLMSTFNPLPYGFRIQYPVSDFVSAGGKRLEGQPIRPDVALDSTALGSDLAVQAAVEALERQP